MIRTPRTIPARLVAGLCLGASVAIAGTLPSGAAAQQARPASTLPWSAPATTQVTTEERRFRSGDAELAGTLHLPRSGKPVAAVVVTHSASSPLRTSSLYEHLRKILPAMGVAVFIYDRRGSGQSGEKSAGGNYALLADDAIAAARSLKADPRIDPQRIGTWGLSQGGWISPLAASRSRDFAFVVSVSAPLVTADVQMMFSSTNHLRANGYSAADIEQMTATRKAVDDYMRGTVSREFAQQKVDAAKDKAWFKYLYLGRTVPDRAVSGWRKEIANDPLKNLEAVTVPTLVIYGADDAIVPVARSSERLQALAPRMPNLRYHVIEGADHAMQMSADLQTTLDPKHDGTERPDSPEYFALLSSWLGAHGLVAD